MALVSRNPFSRTELHRERAYLEGRTGGCTWCGGVKFTPNRRQYLFQYRTETDGGSTHFHRGLFCDRSCHDSYHG